MYLRKLIELVKPPLHPLNCGNPRKWYEAEEQLGYTLPNDYKDFINLYGTGTFDMFLSIYNPFSRNKYLNLFYKNEVVKDAISVTISKFDDFISFKD